MLGYVIVFKKGYQDVSKVQGDVVTTVNGLVFTNYSDDEFDSKVLHPEWYRRIWSVADIVVPPTQTMVTFIATNIVITQNQTQGTCPEDPHVLGARCNKENNTCVAGTALFFGNGIMTGNCVHHPVYNESTCEILSWCPIEVDDLPLKNGSAVLGASKEFTILVKNNVDFPKFSNAKRRNIRDYSNTSFLKNCIYDPVDFPGCPVFRIGDIVRWSGIDDYDKAALQGAIIAVIINWDCNFDLDMNACFPTYKFINVTDPDDKLSPGFNFRYATYFGDHVRTLYKMYGIRLSFIIHGQAGKFSIVPLIQNIGAGLGLLAIQVIICDIVVLHFLKGRGFFKKKKYEEAFSSIYDSSTVVTKRSETKRQA